MQTNSKYSEIEISNIEVIKFLDIASCYIILAVIMAKTEKRIKNFFNCKYREVYPIYSEKWKKEEKAIFLEKFKDGKEVKNEELDKKEKMFKETQKREKEFIGLINQISSKFREQEEISEKINNEGIRIEENAYQKREYILKESIEQFISAKDESYKFIESKLLELKEFEQIENAEINVDEIIEELKSTIQLVQKIQEYI